MKRKKVNLKDVDVGQLKDRADKIVEAVADQAADAFEKAKESAATHTHDLAKAADSALTTIEQHLENDKAALKAAAPLVVVQPKKKKKRGRKICGLGLLGGLAAGAGYLLWKRSQPVEDPWSEEYWVELQDEINAAALEEEAKETVESVVEEAEELIDEAADKKD